MAKNYEKVDKDKLRCTSVLQTDITRQRVEEELQLCDMEQNILDKRVKELKVQLDILNS